MLSVSFKDMSNNVVESKPFVHCVCKKRGAWNAGYVGFFFQPIGGGCWRAEGKGPVLLPKLGPLWIASRVAEETWRPIYRMHVPDFCRYHFLSNGMNFSHGLNERLLAFLCPLVDGHPMECRAVAVAAWGNRKILSPLFDLIPPRTIGLATPTTTATAMRAFHLIPSVLLPQ